MPKLFLPNLDRRGRMVRAVLGSLIVVGGVFVVFWQVSAGVAVLVTGAFVLFEAFRGWCLVRACGIKTKL